MDMVRWAIPNRQLWQTVRPHWTSGLFLQADELPSLQDCDDEVKDGNNTQRCLGAAAQQMRSVRE